MKLLILGATGRTGLELVNQGLKRGFEVTALVRSPQKIQIQNEGLRVVTGNPLDESMLAQVLAGHDAVLSTIGHLDLKRSYVVTDGARALVTAMKDNNVRRLVIISSTLVAPGGSFLTRIPRYITRHALNDSAEMEKVIKRTSLDWTIVRLVRLTNGPETQYQILENEPPSLSASISRKTVAACMLNLISNESNFKGTISIRASR